MTLPIPIPSLYWEGADVWTVARIVGPDGSVVLSVDVNTETTVTVYDVSDPSTAKYSTPITTPFGMESALTVDGYWTKDATGYSFKNRLIANSHNFEGGHTYSIEYVITSDTFGAIPVVHRVQIKSLTSL